MNEEISYQIIARLAEEKGWYKQGVYWVKGHESCPDIQCKIENYRPTEDLNQAIKEVIGGWVLYFSDGKWYVREEESWLAENESLAMAICLAKLASI